MVRDGAKRLLTMRVNFVPRIEVLILRSGARAASRRMGHDKNAGMTSHSRHRHFGTGQDGNDDVTVPRRIVSTN
jgi:hypothetical protein